MNVYTTYTRPLSVWAQYSRKCPIISSSCYNSSLVCTEIVLSLAWYSVGAHDQIFIIVWQLWSFLWGALSDKRTGLSFVYAAGPRQRSLSLFPWIFRPYFTISVLRLPFSSPPITRRVTVEVFDPASTRVCRQRILSLPYIAAERTWTYNKHISFDRYPSSLLPCRSDLQKTRHVVSVYCCMTSPRTRKQLPLLLRLGPCLESFCLATRWSNPLQYIHC
jgi:hypothetical protein